MEILIDITGKVAKVVGTPAIVCGNKDYTLRFTFSAEWLGLAAKTARFVWTRNGEPHYEDVAFTGNTVAVPLMTDISTVLVGVYAGDLRTTTPARIPCVKSILCGGGTHEEPTPDVYAQLLQMIEQNSMQTPVTLAVEERNSSKPFTFWLGTQAEYDAIPVPERVENCLYIITDDPTYEGFNTKLDTFETKLEELETYIDDIRFGDIPVNDAFSARTAGYGDIIKPAAGYDTEYGVSQFTAGQYRFSTVDFSQGWYAAEIQLSYKPDDNSDQKYYSASFKTRPFSLSGIGEQELAGHGEQFIFPVSASKWFTGAFYLRFNRKNANILTMVMRLESSLESPAEFYFRLVGVHQLTAMK